MTYVPVPKQAPASPVVVPQAVSGVAGAVTLSFAAGVRETSTTVTLIQDCVITVGAAAAGADQVMTVDLLQGGSGGFVPSFSNVSWGGGVAPAFNTVAGKRDTIQLRGVGGDVMGWPVAMSRVPLVSSVPGAPSGVTAVAGVLQTTIGAAGVAAFPAVTGYTILRGTAAGGEAAAPIATNVALPFIDTGLSAGTTYFYTVAAVNAAGTGPASAEVSATALAAGAMPGAPSSISVNAGVGAVTISVPAVTAVPAVTGYTVYRGMAAGGEAGAPVATNVALPFVDGGVVAGTTYFYRVAALNGVGTGGESPEGQGTPMASAGAPLHYALLPGADAVLYASPSAAFNPGGAAFDMQAFVRMAAWATGGSVETNVWGCWDINAAGRLWRLGLTTDGRIRASWATGASTNVTATSTVAVGAAGGSDLWLRALVVPISGAVTFYTSAVGVGWQQLGSVVAASGSGAVYAASPLPYLVIGSNASAPAGPQAEQFVGRFYEARLYVNGVLVTDPQIGAGGVSDSKGFVYGKSAAVVYV